ncbi:uncharacterized protein LOC131308167 [Rhododendron vialii]|uniref:uncharacterized protein LOC131308167 n=1 Tax=Rhododendron vialii TaxID=182163 RepID=UPI0026604D51|nr:uncharacterized protein LOC131308167 [Rhododendron vialii]
MEQGGHSRASAFGVTLWVAMVLWREGDSVVTSLASVPGSCSTSGLLAWPWGYIVVELERFTVLEINLSSFLRPTQDYAAWRERNLAGPLRLGEFRQVRFSATITERKKKGQEGATKRARGGRSDAKVIRDLPELLWEIEVMAPPGAQRVIDFPQSEEPFEPITCQVPVEWAHKARRRMLPMENLL